MYGEDYPGGTGEPGGLEAPTRHEPPSIANVVAVIIIAAVLVAAAIGLVIGHAIWAPSPLTTPTVLFPGVTVQTVPPASSAPGAPANAGPLASQADRGLVDINVVDSYQAIEGAGTGMVLSETGEVLTNNHVIEGATSVSVRDVENGRTYKGTVVGYDRTGDVAVIKLTGASGLKTATIGSSATVKAGDGVVVVGNAEGTGGTPSYSGGSVTALDQSITAQDEISGVPEQLSGLIETNANVYPGDSGGALVDSQGEVVGMVTAGTEGFEFQSSANQGFAIPINQAMTIAGEIESRQASDVVHIGPTPFLGVEARSPFFGVSGAEVVEVFPGSPAARAGLVRGDTITALNGQAVTSPEDLTNLLMGFAPGSTVQVQYLDTSGAEHTVSLRIASGPPQ